MEATYASVEEGDAYFLVHLYADSWNNSSTEDKTSALTMATRSIKQLRFLTSTNNDPTTDIPQIIKDACCDEALELLNGADPEREMSTAGQGSQGFSSVRSSYDAGFIKENLRNGITSVVAWNKLLPYLADDGRSLKISRIS